MQKNSFPGLLEDNLLPNKFGGDITFTNILLAEKLLKSHIFYLFIEPIIQATWKFFEYKKKRIFKREREEKFTIYCWVYVVHKLYTKVKFSRNRNTEYSEQCSSISLFYKIDSDSA